MCEQLSVQDQLTLVFLQTTASDCFIMGLLRPAQRPKGKGHSHDSLQIPHHHSLLKC